ncbi:zinc finger protein 34 [Stomoxys calcitrans]|uniref:zinc finger protein 34 n=1 Tax=Stomoxys calcitrans TaxID=35570 RepID=UPI0027E2CC61|nr:zinc finger protein 34 [Stomoxys calcitrans]
MVSTINCRLCWNTCKDIHRKLYDANGQRTDLYNWTAKYFATELLDTKDDNNDTKVLCNQCWYHISEFHAFQESILQKQNQLSRIRIRNTMVVPNESLPNTSDFLYDVQQLYPKIIPTSVRRNEETTTYLANESSNGLHLGENELHPLQNMERLKPDVLQPMMIEPNKNLNQPSSSISLETQNNTSGRLDNKDVTSLLNSSSPHSSQKCISICVKSDEEQVSYLIAPELAVNANQEDVRSNLTPPLLALSNCAMEERMATFDKESSLEVVSSSLHKVVPIAEETIPQARNRKNISLSVDDSMPTPHNKYLGSETTMATDPKLSTLAQQDIDKAHIQNDSSESFTDSEFDEPFGIFVGGEFGESASKTDTMNNHNFSSDVDDDDDDNIPLAQYAQSSSKSLNKSKDNGPTVMTAMDYDKSRTDFESDIENECHPMTQQMPKDADNCVNITSGSEEEPDYEAMTTQRRKKKISYKSNLKRLNTVEEYDAFIAKWRPELECEICHEKFSTFSLLLQHFQQQHPDEKCHITCCQLKLYYRYEIEKHIYYHTEPEAFKCEVCYKVFTMRSTLIYHQQGKHAGYRLNCPNCPKTFQFSQSLQKHIKFSCNKVTQNRESPHVCQVCDKAFKSKAHLRVHCKQVHLRIRREFACTICDKVFNSGPLLKAHMRLHTGEPRMVECCEYCPKKCSTKKYLYAHIKERHPEVWERRQKERVEKMSMKKTYKCPSCEKVFQSSMCYYDHRRSFHSDKPKYKCSLCPKEYRYLSNVAAHFKRVHFEEWKKKQKTSGDSIK